VDEGSINNDREADTENIDNLSIGAEAIVHSNENGCRKKK